MDPATMAIDTGNTAFMLVCTSLVMLMTPGLAFFYGGLVGRKNVLAIMIQSFVSMGWTTVIWFAFGYSMCFGPTVGGIIGDPTYYAFMNNVTLTSMFTLGGNDAGQCQAGPASRCTSLAPSAPPRALPIRARTPDFSAGLPRLPRRTPVRKAESGFGPWDRGEPLNGDGGARS